MNDKVRDGPSIAHRREAASARRGVPHPSAREDRAAAERPHRVAVVGAGLSGLACARALADHGHRVRVFEKSGGPGGRMATRRAGPWRFDHGAQYFTVSDVRFRRVVDAWRAEGLVASWPGRIAVLDEGAVTFKGNTPERFVGVPGMRAVGEYMAEPLEIVWRSRVKTVERRAGQWQLTGARGAELGAFDAVVVSAPAPQTAVLLEDAAPGMSAMVRSVDMAPCWAVMTGFDRPLGLGFDGAFVKASPLSWVARDTSKPGRTHTGSGTEAWVLHGGPDWSRAHLELDPAAAAARLLDAFRSVSGTELEPVHVEAHRWRYALPTDPIVDRCLFDPNLGLAVCGDWCGGPRVEGAFLSGSAAAGRLLAWSAGPGQAGQSVP